jgi:2,3-dimethylmalate lyase
MTLGTGSLVRSSRAARLRTCTPPDPIDGSVSMSRLLGAGQRPTLRELFAAGEMVLAPGCCDPLEARLVEEAGFSAAYMTGFGTAASRLGRPDIGLLTMSEMVDTARRPARRSTSR